MPALASSAYNTVEDVLNRIRLILNDSEVAGGDVITDTAPFSFELVNAGYERVQIELASVGVETYTTEAWLIGLPSMPTVDPEARLIVDDSGTRIIYPNGVGNSFANNPILPADLVLPLKLWERQTATTMTAEPMAQPNDGLRSADQTTFLCQWEWKADGLYFLGALQSQDVKMKYEKHLPKLAAVTDPVPIRGVVNAAAYHSACIFTESRGGTIAPTARTEATAEINLLKRVSARRRQRIRTRRQPYSGRGSRQNYPFI